ncbi:hypothetical protein NPIL_484621 [Nephila pilipes]|uniref:Uncharacterized protein n=1 Tax=Nephila pilipes TaxID=299642 RepID=A0A8X6U595_NEPPI|nr:hypothetical protein NPIL_484621 [Nephila pilipes]
MGYVNDKVFVPPLPVDLEELKQHKTATIHGLDSDTLTRVWVELDYRLNVSRMTKPSSIEHLCLSQTKFKIIPYNSVAGHI